MACIVAKFSSTKLCSFAKGAAVLPAQAAAGGSEEERKSLVPGLRAAKFCGCVGGCTCPDEAPRLPQAWWEGQLAVGIHATLQEREKMLDTIKMVSPQLQKRGSLIDFISIICKYLPLSDTTRHLAVLLLDHFMEKHSIMDFRLKLVALTCLLVAAKLEDRDDYLPTIGHLRCLAKLENISDYSTDSFQRMELYLMKFFGWSISYPTSAHFVGYYNANNCYNESENLLPIDLPLCLDSGSLDADFLDSIAPSFAAVDAPMHAFSEHELEEMSSTPTQQHNKYEQNNLLSLRFELEEITASLLEKALRDYRFLQYPPSMVAAGAVCTARTYMRLFPVWTQRLEYVSCYTQQLLNPVVELFICHD